MIKVFPASSRYSVDGGWLSSNFSFSFGDYYDPDNTDFGVMRVCNDDNLDPGRGFGAHPHSDMEIVTIVLKGSLRHEDNLGNVAVTSFGEVQRMTAGTGIVHAEYNVSPSEELNALQLWFEPRAKGLPPSYETSRFDPSRLTNALLPVVSHDSIENAASIAQDMTIYLTKLTQGQQLAFQQSQNRKTFLFAIEGDLTVNGVPMESRDTARIEAVSKLDLDANADTFLMLIDLP